MAAGVMDRKWSVEELIDASPENLYEMRSMRQDIDWHRAVYDQARSAEDPR